MKCPACGYWNRASYPCCFRCGQELSQAQRQSQALPADELEKTGSLSSDRPTQIRYDEYGNEFVGVDRHDRLALEMLSLQERKRRGELRQKQLRARGAARGFAPSSALVTGSARKNRFFADPNAARRRAEELMVEHEAVDYDGYTEQPTYQTIAGDDAGYVPPTPQGFTAASTVPLMNKKRKRIIGKVRYLPYLALALIILAGGIALYLFVVSPWMAARTQTKDKPQAVITASILDDMAAHTISIPAPEGAQIYIKELRKSYIVTGGMVLFQVADYFWYDLIENLTQPTMEVTLTPFIRTISGEQQQMDMVRYTIEIPQSPITLINPDVTYLEVSTPIYNIQFHVMQNSKVFINGEDFSSFVNTQNGFISYNGAIQPVGNNTFRIAVRSQYYRENTVEIVIHRAVQDIPLDLASTLDDESSKPTMTIKATTRAGASINVLSPHEDLDISRLGSTGEFSFKAILSKIGRNTVEIRADFPAKNPTTVKYEVYYLPPPDIYTKKAWALDSWGYPDLLANMNTRISNTQIYVFTGPVKEIISGKPQLVIMDASDGKGAELVVMVENQTKTEWEVGQRYRIFADAYGMYGNVPRLIARYTYKPQGSGK
jgi:hypothetical protein